MTSGSSIRADDTYRMHLTRLISLIPVPYYLGWPLISTALLMLSLSILMYFEKSFMQFEAFFILSVIIALEGTIVSWAHNRWQSIEAVLLRIVDLPETDIINLNRIQGKKIFSDRKMLTFAAFFILFVHLIGIDHHELSFGSDIVFLAFKFLYYLSVYLEGAGLYILIMTAVAVHSIGRLPLRIDALYSDFHTLGVLYSKFTICAAMVYIVWGFFHIMIPPRFTTIQMIIWFFSFALILFIYFILPQYGIHKMMISIRKGKIQLFSSQLKAAMDGPFRFPADENASSLKDMLIVQDKLSKMSEWPFGLREFFYIAIIIIIPLILILLEIALGWLSQN